MNRACNRGKVQSPSWIGIGRYKTGLASAKVELARKRRLNPKMDRSIRSTINREESITFRPSNSTHKSAMCKLSQPFEIFIFFFRQHIFSLDKQHCEGNR